jgi:hypothetical protein
MQTVYTMEVYHWKWTLESTKILRRLCGCYSGLYQSDTLVSQGFNLSTERAKSKKKKRRSRVRGPRRGRRHFSTMWKEDDEEYYCIRPLPLPRCEGDHRRNEMLSTIRWVANRESPIWKAFSFNNWLWFLWTAEEEHHFIQSSINHTLQVKWPWRRFMDAIPFSDVITWLHMRLQ